MKLSLDVADMCCWVLRTLIFNVADVEFQYYGHVILGLCGGGWGGELLMLDVACTTSRNMVAT
jgi:hypothetical protein